MKKTLLLFTILLISLKCFPQDGFKIDEKYELTSIVARLAGYPEYSQSPIESYNRAIDSCFKPYLDHEMIQYMKQVRENDFIGYNAISSAAALLEIENGTVGFKDNVDLKDYLKEETRWSSKSLLKYVRLLNEFYNDTGFDKFFADNTPLYDDILSKYNYVIQLIDFDWIEQFFGEKLNFPNLYLSAVNGPSNYALSGLGNGDYGTLTGTMDPQCVNPMYLYHASLPLVLHELFHPLSAELLSPYEKDIKVCGDSLWNNDFIIEHATVYGTGEAVVYEYINDLCVLIYLMEHYLVAPEEDMLQAQMLDRYAYSLENEKGYAGIRECLSYYSRINGSGQYKNIADILPELLNYFKNICENIDNIVSDVKSKHPKVTDVIIDSSNGKYDIIKVCFSHKMLNSSGMRPINEVQAFSFYMPFGTGGTAWIDERTFALFVEKLESGKYGTILVKNAFIALNGYAMEEDFELIFEK